MKFEKIIIMIAMAAIILILAGCRTSESNYRAAYERAVANRDSTDVLDETIYNRIRQQALPSERVVAGDTVMVKRELVALENKSQGATLSDAYVVVAQFKQLFNARSLCDRLRDGGYPEATLLVTREPLYYVTCGGGRLEQMPAQMAAFNANPVIQPHTPYPIILEPVK